MANPPVKKKKTFSYTVLGLAVLFVVILVVLFMMKTPGTGKSDRLASIEKRLSALETKKITRKVSTPGSAQTQASTTGAAADSGKIAQVQNRLDDMENKLAKIDEISSRLDEIEQMIQTGEAVKTASASSSRSNKGREAKTAKSEKSNPPKKKKTAAAAGKPAKKSSKRVSRKPASSSWKPPARKKSTTTGRTYAAGSSERTSREKTTVKRVSPGTKQFSSKSSAPKVRTEYRDREFATPDYSGTSYYTGGQVEAGSIHRIGMQYTPAYGQSEKSLRTMNKMAPGMSLYPRLTEYRSGMSGFSP
jgi:hypothetical protein